MNSYLLKIQMELRMEAERPIKRLYSSKDKENRCI